MKRFRRRRPLHVRIAIFAMLALLWSQVVLAGHPACSMGFMALAQIDAVSAQMGESGSHDCHDESGPQADPACPTHCGQATLSSDIARVPDLPPLPAAIPAALATFVILPASPIRHPALPPPVSWHRPTAHPAALLLI
ncbi:hypothetical protein [Aerolutibacter ruishenii]|uniref:DUF2946 family protein n=1 Tax=Aerolutibacter ruishenii TaxID=686800 RepID=A0A562LVB1_9GAMM|nr:hypothetical protein [Lysobacter ruishenii]TWI11493.1 hypothetical protein IP93_01389 [Lysobacter ruishenii]